MGAVQGISVSEIKLARVEHAKLRDRDLAKKLGISEAQLVAALFGEAAVRITTDLDKLIPAIGRLGTVPQ